MHSNVLIDINYALVLTLIVYCDRNHICYLSVCAEVAWSTLKYLIKIWKSLEKAEDYLQGLINFWQPISVMKVCVCSDDYDQMCKFTIIVKNMLMDYLCQWQHASLHSYSFYGLHSAVMRSDYSAYNWLCVIDLYICILIVLLLWYL